MDSEITALDKIRECLTQKKNFVLQGGAGSGKTETLKRTLAYLAENEPNAKVACITYTNAAVQEIRERIDGDITVATIHSFIHSIIHKYKKNIHSIISILFEVDLCDSNHGSYKKQYEKYLKVCEKYEISIIVDEGIPKKKEYSLDSSKYEELLNNAINSLNQIIRKKIEGLDSNLIEYSDSVFDSLERLSYSHDSLLEIASVLLKKFPLLSKIVSDKYDYIFIDEYQDTTPSIIEFFLSINKGIVIGLFGDAMQSIYDTGIGDLNKSILDDLEQILKEDNYRCPPQVISLINNIRIDRLEQKVALKIDQKMKKIELSRDREGEVKLYYHITTDKNERFNLAMKLVEIAKNKHNYKCLMLTNRAIATKLGYSQLFELFSDTYNLDAKDRLDQYIQKKQLNEIVDFCRHYKGKYKNHNAVIKQLKKTGFSMQQVKDKKELDILYEKLLDDKISIKEALDLARECKIIKPSEGFYDEEKRVKKFIKEECKEEAYEDFKSNVVEKGKLLARTKAKKVYDSYLYESYKRKCQKEMFYTGLESKSLKFKEVLNYFTYTNEETDYITMHKTKGSGIDNVLVVLEDFNWNQFKLKDYFGVTQTPNEKIKERSRKMLYVACSRTRKKLALLAIVSNENEADTIKKHFEIYEELFVE